VFLLAIRQALLIALRAVEDRLGMPRSVPTRRRPQEHNRTATDVHSSGTSSELPIGSADVPLMHA